MRQVAEGLWIDTAPMRIVGTKLSANMAVLRLPGGGVLLYSPLSMTTERRDAVGALGPVEHIVAPNTFHHLFAGEWADAFESATVHAAPGLAKKRRDLRIDRELDTDPLPGFDGTIEAAFIDGFRMNETALYYRRANAVVVADLVHNVGRPEDWWTRTYTKLAGFYDRVGVSRVLRWTAFNDRTAARRSIDELLKRPFEKLVVGHGEPVESGAREALEHAYDWLAPARRALPEGR